MPALSYKSHNPGSLGNDDNATIAEYVVPDHGGPNIYVLRAVQMPTLVGYCLLALAVSSLQILALHKHIQVLLDYHGTERYQGEDDNGV
jgi:ribosomal silencing factor RsfS